jgi:hypothetical protein
MRGNPAGAHGSFIAPVDRQRVNSSEEGVEVAAVVVRRTHPHQSVAKGYT